MRNLRTWLRRHVTGSVAEVTALAGIGYWEARVSHGEPPRTQRVGQHFELLTAAQEGADRLAQTLAPHECSSCEQWVTLERRKASRDTKR